jgi:hypothetical protein
METDRVSEPVDITGRAIVNRARVLLAQKEHDERRRITVEKMAQETGLATTTIVPLLNNDMQRYDARTLLRVILYFDCSFDDFFEIIETD